MIASFSGITCGAEEELREALADLRGRFEEALGAFGRGCDADGVADEAGEVEYDARGAVEAMEELAGFLGDYLAEARSIEEKSERLKDDAQARYYGDEEEEG